jgi:hypothetical protein
MSAQEQSRHDQEDITEEHSFDELAMELADGALTRARALKLMGVALVGGLGALTSISVVADPADAKRKRKKKKKHPVAGLAPSSPVLPACTTGKTGCPTTCTCPSGTQCLNLIPGVPGICSPGGGGLPLPL